MADIYDSLAPKPRDPEASLSDREKQILQAVVHTYITTAEPAGSRSIVKRFNMDLSPATVRNVMADLEDMGYLEQVHTSSGRVPTDRGYRYYVDYLMEVQKLTLTERARLEKEFERLFNDADEVLRQTSHLLALASHQTGLVETPSEEVAAVRRIELFPLEGRRMAVILVDSCGRVRTMMAIAEEQLNPDEITKLNRFLNDTLFDVPMHRVTAELERAVQQQEYEERMLANRALGLIAALPVRREGRLYLEGATHLFAQPEFHDVEKAREVFTFLEQREGLAEILRSSWGNVENQSSLVLIGRESDREGMEQISVVAAPYNVGEQRAGMVGVLGPRRMPYSQITGVVEYTANLLSRFLTRLAG